MPIRDGDQPAERAGDVPAVVQATMPPIFLPGCRVPGARQPVGRSGARGEACQERERDSQSSVDPAINSAENELTPW